MFLNLSNHPSATWSPAQRTQAEAIGGEITDFPFPDVPPEADREEVHALGAEVLARMVNAAPKAVMVQGEFTLVHYLVRELEVHGIPCYAATTSRVTEARTLASGAIEKVSRFEFVRFRRY